MRGDQDSQKARSKSLVMGDQSRSPGRPPCPRRLGPVLKAGWLKKQRSIMKNWQQRWFVLRGDQLFYYKDKDETKPQIALSSLTQSNWWPHPPWCGLMMVALCRHHNKVPCSLLSRAAGLVECGQSNPCYGIQTEKGHLRATLISLGKIGEENLKDLSQRMLLVIDLSLKEKGDSPFLRILPVGPTVIPLLAQTIAPSPGGNCIMMLDFSGFWWKQLIEWRH
ncbi:Rho GTPase-activating protein 22 [Camelus dromedarius]|uniref:Rho GTPase-activating protein 22 n=1 Tax=Camelus dromedarius TaxID=9838 RepID=A0A5N4DKT7_CAMDR|nr:Rho GTPase-activating protein 22 [Camelus dromedarius]